MRQQRFRCLLSNSRLSESPLLPQEAVAAGGKIGVLSVFEPTVPSIRRELADIAEEMGRTDQIQLSVEFVPDALPVLHAGDEERYNNIIADAAERMHKTTPGGLDVVVLAMFSMACAGETVQHRLGSALPVLTSPNSAVAKLKRLLV